MKACFVVYLLFFSLYGNAQDRFVLLDPGNAEVKLDNGWTYKMGDSLITEGKGGMAAGWKPFRPAEDIHDSIPDDAKSGIGWMRLVMKVDERLWNASLMMLVKQSVASEIYLDGKLIKKFGVISPDPTEIKAYDPKWEPIALDFSTGDIHILSVRFAVQPGVRYAGYYGATNPFLSATVMRQDRAMKTYKGIYMRPWMDVFMNGILFMVFILHLSFFLMYREQKANLFFSLAALLLFFGSIMGSYYYYTSLVDQKYLLAIVVSIVYLISNLLMLTSILIFTKRKNMFSVWVLTGILISMTVLGAIWYKKGFLAGPAITPLIVYGFIIFISYDAQRKKVYEARILTAGFSIAIISICIFVLHAIFENADHLLTTLFNPWSYFFLLFILSPPASMSIFLAYDFAQTSKRLQQKLVEVELLSEKNITAEKEKQEILSQQNLQLESRVQERTAELNKSLHQLKSTQAQLIQSEKMASLGELTAGIAHEIQNPLNFVNNFSEVNIELASEMTQAAERGDLQEVKELSANILNNQEKINEHGKRAEVIVKSMLQHSRSGGGNKEPTEVNKLAEEYLKLVYQGLRAKEKSFQAEIELNLDPTIEMIPLVPQDIGRVLFNLSNNAFYAIMEKQKSIGLDFQPAVVVKTKRLHNQVSITICDNGTGIPDTVKEKIFQPFFTTKPTGQGTGLGLSLSYDIVKAHGGSLTVESKQKEFTRFTLILPIK